MAVFETDSVWIKTELAVYTKPFPVRLDDGDVLLISTFSGARTSLTFFDNNYLGFASSLLQSPAHGHAGGPGCGADFHDVQVRLLSDFMVKPAVHLRIQHPVGQLFKHVKAVSRDVNPEAVAQLGERQFHFVLNKKRMYPCKCDLFKPFLIPRATMSFYFKHLQRPQKLAFMGQLHVYSR